MVYVCNYKENIMIRTAIFGSANNLINILENINQIKEYHFIGAYCNKTSAKESLDKNLKFFSNPEELISVADVIIVAERPGDYDDLIRKALKKSKHILIFPDSSLLSKQLEFFVKLAEEAGVHLFLFNKNVNNKVPGYIASRFGKPEFIDIYRYPENTTSQKNIFEIFYEEIFTIMRINKGNPRKYFTTSIPNFSTEPFLLNLRIEFENGTSANLTINKYIRNNKSRMEIFGHDGMVKFSHETGDLKIISIPDNNESVPNSYKNDNNDLLDGLKLFLQTISSSDYRLHPSENAINAHIFASKIIQQLVPSHEKSYFY